jgi:hypothetical protein
MQHYFSVPRLGRACDDPVLRWKWISGGPRMEASSVFIVVVWIGLHFGALVCAWATRLVDGSRLETPLQIGFFAAMSGVGGAAWICRHLDLAIWMVSAVTLIAMVLTAVFDFRRFSEPVRTLG